MKPYQFIITFVLAVAGIYLFLSWTSSKDAFILEIGACVSEMAHANGFNGTHEEEWKLFASECN